MSNATITITGFGPVQLKTDLDEVTLVGAWTQDGSPVNCKTKKVSRDQRKASKAMRVETVWLTEVKPGFFQLFNDTEAGDDTEITS